MSSRDSAWSSGRASAVISVKLSPVEKHLVRACAARAGADTVSQFGRALFQDVVAREFGRDALQAEEGEDGGDD